MAKAWKLEGYSATRAETRGAEERVLEGILDSSMGWAKKSTFIAFIFVLLLRLEAVCVGIDVVVRNRIRIRIRIRMMVHDNETVANVVNKILLVVLIHNHVVDKRLNIIQKIHV